MLYQDTTRNTTLSATDSDERRKRRVSWTERLTVVWVELKDKLPSRSSSPTPSHDTESLSLSSPDSDSKGRFSFTAEYPDSQHDVSIGASATSDSSCSDADVASAALPARPRRFIPGHFRYFCFRCHERIGARGFCGDECERMYNAARAEEVSVEGDDDSVAETIDERPPSSASNYSTDDLDPIHTTALNAPPPQWNSSTRDLDPVHSYVAPPPPSSVSTDDSEHVQTISFTPPPLPCNCSSCPPRPPRSPARPTYPPAIRPKDDDASAP